MTTNEQDYAIEAIGSVPRCQTCGSERVVRDAWACFNPETGIWELEQVFDAARCHVCSKTTDLAWRRHVSPPHRRVRELNDTFRTTLQGNGSVLVTSGVQASGESFTAAAIQAVQQFDAFGPDNDPWGEHDFGAVEIKGEKVFWKIDCYDPSLKAGSENPANEALTHRVLTIMLASEY